MLIGVYGRDAVTYADHQRSERRDLGDLDTARTWNLIACEIEHLMRTAPAVNLH